MQQNRQDSDSEEEEAEEDAYAEAMKTTIRRTLLTSFRMTARCPSNRSEGWDHKNPISCEKRQIDAIPQLHPKANRPEIGQHNPLEHALHAFRVDDESATFGTLIDALKKQTGEDRDKDLADVFLDDEDFVLMESFLQAFKPVYCCTKVLQTHANE